MAMWLPCGYSPWNKLLSQVSRSFGEIIVPLRHDPSVVCLPAYSCEAMDKLTTAVFCFTFKYKLCI